MLKSFKQVAIEAITCSKPVVSSAVRGLRDVVVDSETILLVPPSDVQTLHEALLTLLSNPSLRAQISAAIRQRARLFIVSAVVYLIEQIYAELISETRSATLAKTKNTMKASKFNSDNKADRVSLNFETALIQKKNDVTDLVYLI